MAIADFVHLKVRSAYSLTEGANKVDRIVSLAKEQAMPAVAVTDRNNLFGALEFAQYAAKAGVQPIIGCDIGIRREEEGGIAAAGRWSRPTTRTSPRPRCTRRTMCCSASNRAPISRIRTAAD